MSYSKIDPPNGDSVAMEAQTLIDGPAHGRPGKRQRTTRETAPPPSLQTTLFSLLFTVVFGGLGLKMLLTAPDAEWTTDELWAPIDLVPAPNANCSIGIMTLKIPAPNSSRRCRAEFWDLQKFDLGNYHFQHRLLPEFIAIGKANGTKFRKVHEAKLEKETEAEFVILDDLESNFCFVVDYAKATPKTRPVLAERYRKARSDVISAIVNRAKVPLAVIEAHPLYHARDVDSQNLLRFAEEFGQVPVDATGRSKAPYVIVPYTTPSNPFLRPAGDFDGDEYFIYFLASCYNGTRESDTIGKKFRLKMAEVLDKLVNPHGPIRIECETMGAVSVSTLLSRRKKLAKARFCPVVSGDTASSNLLGEVISAGCIPVFLGPPYHSAPYLPFLDYSKFSVWYRVQSTPWWRNWNSNPVWTEDPLIRPLVRPGARYSKDLPSLAMLAQALGQISRDEIVRLRRGVREVQDYFVSMNAEMMPGGVGRSVYASNMVLAAGCEVLRRKKEVEAKEQG
jgi:hypothetical protein